MTLTEIKKEQKLSDALNRLTLQSSVPKSRQVVILRELAGAIEAEVLFGWGKL